MGSFLEGGGRARTSSHILSARDHSRPGVPGSRGLGAGFAQQGAGNKPKKNGHGWLGRGHRDEPKVTHPGLRFLPGKIEGEFSKLSLVPEHISTGYNPRC